MNALDFEHGPTELARTLGITYLEASRECVREELAVEGLRQISGVVHGGINALMVEDAGSVLAYLNAPEGKIGVGVDVTVTHVRSARSGYIIAEARLVHCGRTICVADVEIRTDEGDLTAVGRLTCSYIPIPQAMKGAPEQS